MTRTFSKAAFAALAPALFAVTACESTGGAVSVLSTAPIAAGSTYAWDPARPPRELTPSRRIDDDKVRKGITTVVDAKLAAKGLRLVEPSQARYLVAYDVHVQDSNAPDSWLVRLIDYADTRMTLDITDASTRRVVWRAASQRRVYRFEGPRRDLSGAFAHMVNALPTASFATMPAPGSASGQRSVKLSASRPNAGG